jgi:hypothetical protein
MLAQVSFRQPSNIVTTSLTAAAAESFCEAIFAKPNSAVMLTNLSLLGLEPAAAGSEDFPQEWYRAMIRTGLLKGDGGLSLMSTLEAALQDALLPDWFVTSSPSLPDGG